MPFEIHSTDSVPETLPVSFQEVAPFQISFIDQGPNTYGAGFEPGTSVRSVWYPSSAFIAIDYHIQTSPDGVGWSTVLNVTGNTSTDRTDSFPFAPERYIRMVVTARNPDTDPSYAQLALVEFTVDGDSPVVASSPDASFNDGVNFRIPSQAIDANVTTWWQPVSSSAGVNPTPANLAIIEFDRGTTVPAAGDLGEVAPMLTAELFQADDLHGSRILKFEKSHHRKWQHLISEPGSGSMQLQLKVKDEGSTDFVPNPEWAAFARNTRDVVRLKLLGRPIFSFFVKDYGGTVLDPSGNTDNENLEISGPGLFYSYERGLIYPSRGVGQQPQEKDRRFNYTAFDYDDSAWPAAKIIADWLLMKNFIAFITDGALVLGAGFPDLLGLGVIGPPSGNMVHAPEGDAYFRQAVNVPASGPYTIILWVDDYGDLYVDGQNILSGVGATTSTSTILWMTAGTHEFAWNVHNYPDNWLFPGYNPMASVWAGFFGGGIFTGTTPSFWSNATAKCVEYPASIPGMTVGRVIRKVTEEMQNRGVSPWLQLMFSDTRDSANKPWPVVADIATKVGSGVMTFLMEVADTYCDIRVNDFGQVYAYGKDQMRMIGGSTTSLRPKTISNPSGILTGLKLTGSI